MEKAQLHFPAWAETLVPLALGWALAPCRISYGLGELEEADMLSMSCNKIPLPVIMIFLLFRYLFIYFIFPLYTVKDNSKIPTNQIICCLQSCILISVISLSSLPELISSSPLIQIIYLWPNSQLKAKMWLEEWNL